MVFNKVKAVVSPDLPRTYLHCRPVPPAVGFGVEDTEEIEIAGKSGVRDAVGGSHVLTKESNMLEVYR